MLRLASASAACAALLAAAAAAPPPKVHDGLLRGVRFENQTELEINLNQSLKYLQEFNSGSSVTNGCTGGLKNVHVCYQICSEWCWATVTTMTGDYYKGQQYCQGFECAVASREFGQQCCPFSNSCNNQPTDGETACNRGGTGQQMAEAASYFTGGRFVVYGVLSQSVLDAAISNGRVVMILVQWQGGGGHALIIGGCDQGTYYLHDPWGWYNPAPPQWMGLSYGGLLQYVAPNGGIGQWVQTVTWDLNGEESHKAALEFAAANRAVNGSAVVV